MAYTNVISRTDAAATIPEQVADLIRQNLVNESAIMRLSRRVAMGTNQTRMPVISALPVAYFVNGDTGLKQTTEVNWANKYLNVEEIAAIVPIPEAVLDDSSYDVWGTVRPLLEQAAGRTLDAAVFFGTNKPSSWPDDIATAAAAAGNTLNRGTNNAAAGGIAGDISDLMGKVEADGFDVNGFVASRTYRGRLRQARDNNGQRLMDIEGNVDSVEGVPVVYALRGQWPSGSGSAELFAGDFAESIVGVRQDFTYKILDQAVLTDGSGNIVFNLAQQDMVAMRLVFRVAWQVSNALNYDQPTEGSRYPFAALLTP